MWYDKGVTDVVAPFFDIVACEIGGMEVNCVRDRKGILFEYLAYLRKFFRIPVISFCFGEGSQMQG